MIPEPTDLRLVTANAGSLTFRWRCRASPRTGAPRTPASRRSTPTAPARRARRPRRAPETACASPSWTTWPSLPALGGPAPCRRLGEQRAGPAGGRGSLRPARRGGPGGPRAPSWRRRSRRPPRGTRSCATTRRWSPGPAALRGRAAAGRPRLRRAGRADARPRRRCGEPDERGAPLGQRPAPVRGAGVPTLHYGPGDVRLAHGPDESVPLDQVVTAAEVFVALLRDGVV